MLGVHERTIRRDIEALSKAGFPLYDDKTNGTPIWKLNSKPFKAFEETGLSLSELCAVHFARTLMTTLIGAPFQDDLERALMKLERALPTSCRKFIDRIPRLLKAKASGRKKLDGRKSREIVNRAVDASLTGRRITMRYYSSSSRRMKDYVVEPLRVTHVAGGIYLTAWVPAYNEMRTFAIERVRTLAMMDEHFDPRPLPPEPFANSLGVHTGSPELIEIEFTGEAVDYVREREWHRSQEMTDLPDGSLRLRLCVSNDRPLRSWILSFGQLARVVAPAHLARGIFEALDEARENYQPRLTFEMLRMPAVDESLATLPLLAKHSKAS